MDVRRKQDTYRCQNAKTASTTVLEIYGEIVRNCKNTKIKNMYLRHHTTVKLEIDRVDLSGWEEKSQEWRMQAWRFKPFLPHRQGPETSICRDTAMTRPRWLSTQSTELQTVKLAMMREKCWQRRQGTTEDTTHQGKGLPVDGPRWWQVSSR